MKIKQVCGLKVANIVNRKGFKSVNKPTKIYLAVNKKEKDFGVVFEQNGLIAFASHLPAYNHKEAWSSKLPFIEIFEKCKAVGLREIRVYVADAMLFEKASSIANNLNRLAVENNLLKFEMFFLKQGDYVAEYQLAEHTAKKMNDMALGELKVKFKSWDDVEFEPKSPKDYLPKFMAKKPAYIGKNHANHGRNNILNLKQDSAKNERNFKNVMVELLENGAPSKHATKEAIKYVNEVLYRDDLGYVTLDSGTLLEWTNDWIQTLKLNQKDQISIVGLEGFLLGRVALAKEYLDHKRAYVQSPQPSSLSRPRMAAIA